MLWNAFLELFSTGLFALSHFYGGQLAAAIVSFSLLARVVLLPFTVRQALRARAHARRLADLRPAMKAIADRWKKDPVRQQKELLALYHRNGVAPVDGGLIKGALAQAPVHLGLFGAVRAAVSLRGVEQGFLWVTNLARPDMGIALVTALALGISGWAGATQGKEALSMGLPALSGLLMATFMSAGLGLYLVATGMVGTLQGLIVRRVEARVGLESGTGKPAPARSSE